MSLNFEDLKAANVKLRRDNMHLLEVLEGISENQRTIEEQNDILMSLAHEMEVERNKAQAANRAKSKFLAMMSHELRTPLNAIIGFSEIISQEIIPVSDKCKEYSMYINDAGTHLLNIINDILNLSRIESGMSKINIDKISIQDLIYWCNSMMSNLISDRNLKYSFNIASDVDILWADEQKIKQIIINVLSNATKFTPENGKISLKVFQNEKEEHVFEIKDTGIGISDKALETIFLPFYQSGDDLLSRKYEGTGLGLTLSKTLVELHNGTFEIDSELSVGTTITITIPKNH